MMSFLLIILLLIVISSNSYIISNTRCKNYNIGYKNGLEVRNNHKINSNIITNMRLYSNNNEGNNEVEEDNDESVEDNDETVEENDNTADNSDNDSDDNVENKEAIEEPVELTEEEKAIIQKEKEIKNQLELLENELRKSRLDLVRTRDKISESGKNGYFIQQAQVAEFLKKKDIEQKERVSKNKREFVIKMLPVVDLFREAPIKAVANTEREEQMHKNFGSLLTSVLTVFEKYGYKEFQADIGVKYEPSKHQVNEMIVDADNDGLIVTAISSGWISEDGDVVKRAIVNVGKKG